MKAIRTLLFTFCFVLMGAVSALADSGAGDTGGVMSSLLGLARSAGYFLLVMGAIFLCLFLTRKIGEKWGKH